jgi:mono/diheme cytochrome c family protein
MNPLKMILPLTALILLSCQPALDRQPKTKPFSASPLFANNSSARPLMEGVVTFHKKSEVPPLLTAQLVTRGKELFEIHCSVCHGLAGHGYGLATQRGFPHPIDYQQLFIQGFSNPLIYQIISHGLTPMPAFAGILEPEDRWALVHYVRVLELRGHIPAQFLSAEDNQHLKMSQQ